MQILLIDNHFSIFLKKNLEYREYIQLYKRAHELGLHCVAHAGEEGSASYVTINRKCY